MTIPYGLLSSYDPQGGSATGQMLGLLAQNQPAGQPGQPTPPPAAPMTPAPSAPPPSPSQNLLGKIHDAIQGHLTGNAPDAYQGLLSNQDIQQARPGILASLAGDTYSKNLDHLIALKQMAVTVGEHQRVMQARYNIPQNLQAGPDDTMDQTRQKLAGLYEYSMQHGDTDMMKSVGSRMYSLFAQPRQDTSQAPHTLDTANGIMQWNPASKAFEQTGMQPAAKPMASNFSAVPGTDPTTGKPTVFTLNTRTGQMTSTGVGKPGPGAGGGNLPAPMAAKVGQAGEMMKKASDLLPQMDALDKVTLPGSAAQDVAANGVGAFGMHIPGTQGLGSLMLNRDPVYSKYQASLSPFILAAAHALSGARINMDQVQQIRNSIEFKPGDAAAVRGQKRKNMVDLLNSISGSLPGDAMASQEDQMEPSALASLKGYGYRGAARLGSGSGGGLGSRPKPSQAQYDTARSKFSDAQLAQHYDLSGVKRK